MFPPYKLLSNVWGVRLSVNATVAKLEVEVQ
jgi:hypothetical protein